MDLPRSAWRKSTRSGSSGNCVEVAMPSNVVLVRDSKDAQGALLSFSPGEWSGFIEAIKTGNFDA